MPSLCMDPKWIAQTINVVTLEILTREKGKDATTSLFKELWQEFEGEAQFGRNGIFGFVRVKETVPRMRHIQTAMFMYQVITSKRQLHQQDRQLLI